MEKKRIRIKPGKRMKPQKAIATGLPTDGHPYPHPYQPPSAVLGARCNGCESYCNTLRVVDEYEGQPCQLPASSSQDIVGRDRSNQTRQPNGNITSNPITNCGHMSIKSMPHSNPIKQNPDKLSESKSCNQCKAHRDSKDGASYQPHSSCNLKILSKREASPRPCHAITANLTGKMITIIILNTVLSNLGHLIQTQTSNDRQLQTSSIPGFVRAENECLEDGDCGYDKKCFHNSCICPKSHPIDDKRGEQCLQHALMNESCSISEQCLGQSTCIEGVCICAPGSVIIWNPSTKIDYCHPKVLIREACNYDLQCPKNAFCSGKTSGCLCQNGYGESNIKREDGIEAVECLPKSCSKNLDCESDFHTCEEGLCLCLATHWDPNMALCYKYGSQGGGPLQSSNITNAHDTDGDNDVFDSILNDLTNNGDSLWIIILILAALTLLVFMLMIFILRKYYLGYCWTAHKKEYEPNNASSPKSQFNKNSVNNTSFRKKNVDLDDDCDSCDDDAAADRSNLMNGKKDSRKTRERTTDGDNINGNHYVTVDMRAAVNKTDCDPSSGHNKNFQDGIPSSRPLPSSLSTPV